MANTEKKIVEDRFDSAVEGKAVSRRWLLKNTANMAAGTFAVSGLGVAAAEAKAAPVPEGISTVHDSHSNHEPEYNPAAFEGWESF